MVVDTLHMVARLGRPLDDLRFIYLTGKGGVGKSTVTAALARALAARGRRVLVALCNAKERLSPMLGSPPIGAEVIHVGPNIDAVNIVPERALEEYGVLVLKSRSLYKALFENRYVQTFFRAVPGLHEWSMLGKAWWHTTELLSGRTTEDLVPPYGDGWKYETVIVDGPATGHGLDMLGVPKVIMDVAPPGPLRREAERALKLFQDPTHAGVVLVTLPEDMPTNETLELAAQIRSMRIPIQTLVVNQYHVPLFAADVRAAVIAQAKLPPLDPGRARATREEIQAQALAKLATLQVPTVFLPHLVTREPSEPSSILTLAQGL